MPLIIPLISPLWILIEVAAFVLLVVSVVTVPEELEKE
jgi:hypothetical protein